MLASNRDIQAQIRQKHFEAPRKSEAKNVPIERKEAGKQQSKSPLPETGLTERNEGTTKESGRRLPENVAIDQSPAKIHTAGSDLVTDHAQAGPNCGDGQKTALRGEEEHNEVNGKHDPKQDLPSVPYGIEPVATNDVLMSSSQVPQLQLSGRIDKPKDVGTVPATKENLNTNFVLEYSQPKVSTL